METTLLRPVDDGVCVEEISVSRPLPERRAVESARLSSVRGEIDWDSSDLTDSLRDFRPALGDSRLSLCRCALVDLLLFCPWLGDDSREEGSCVEVSMFGTARGTEPRTEPLVLSGSSVLVIALVLVVRLLVA